MQLGNLPSASENTLVLEPPILELGMRVDRDTSAVVGDAQEAVVFEAHFDVASVSACPSCAAPTS